MAIDLPRIARHLTTLRGRVRRAFPPKTLAAIEQAVKAGEAAHDGEIRFVVEGALDGLPLLRGQSARERAIEVFSQWRVWDTAHNNGVLVYVLLADRRIEIVADRGIDTNVGPGGWEAICREMEQAFRRGDYEQGAVACVHAVTQHLAKSAAGTTHGNELPDAPEFV